MKVLGAIIAGGQSSRMGGREKLFLQLGASTLLDQIVRRLGPQVEGLMINANGDLTRFESTGLPVVADGMGQGQTPLSGLLATLEHGLATGFDAVLTVPSDTPFLPRDLRLRLAGHGAAIAGSGGQAHFLTGFWPTGLASDLRQRLALQGLRRAKDWVEAVGARQVPWPDAVPDPFFNINTPEDLLMAQNWVGKA